MTVGIYTNQRKDKELQVTNRVVQFLKDKCTVNLMCDFASFEDMCKTVDFLIVLGGDGTLLRVARIASKFDLPILGINLGTVGFLAEVEKDKIEDCLTRFLAGDYTLENRFMINASVVRDGETIAEYDALNDIVIAAASFKKVVSMDLYVNGDFITSYDADGVIAATPTGSTAYSLSAGGPITDSVMELMLITPICPHTMSSRPLILPPDKKITVEIIKDREHAAQITADGREGEKLCIGDKVVLTASERKTKLIRLNDMNFYETLRKKMSD